VLGRDGASTAEQIVAREKERRGWAGHVTASYLMAKWAWLVSEIASQTYPDHIVVEEYANDLDSRKLLQTLLDAAPPEVADPLSHWLAQLDHQFMEATVRAERPIHGSPDPASPHVASPWHWRIPRRPSGQLAEDLTRRGLL
jgi:hypothetical protein